MTKTEQQKLKEKQQTLIDLIMANGPEFAVTVSREIMFFKNTGRWPSPSSSSLQPKKH